MIFLSRRICPAGLGRECPPPPSLLRLVPPELLRECPDALEPWRRSATRGAAATSPTYASGGP